MTRKWKIASWAASIGLLLAAGAYVLVVPVESFANPEAEFTTRVGLAVPAGVRIVQHASAINDNFLHTTHFWLLEGDPDALRTLVLNPRFGRSDDDAGWVVPGAAAQFGMKLGSKDLAEGYESDHPRNRWFLMLKGQRRAIYVL